MVAWSPDKHQRRKARVQRRMREREVDWDLTCSPEARELTQKGQRDRPRVEGRVGEGEGEGGKLSQRDGGWRTREECAETAQRVFSLRLSGRPQLLH